MTLAELLRDLTVLRAEGDTRVPVGGIATDSRQVQPGDLFVALHGQQQDGHRFIGDAVARGAAAVVCQQEPPDGPPRPPAFVRVKDTHRALGLLASAFYGHPSRRIRVVGVTGTDGKTTTTHLVAEILRAAGQQVGSCTTVELHDGRSSRPNQIGFTTPQAPELQRLLSAMVAAGTETAALEVSSHALATGRVEGCEFDVAVFTNLSPEHLDYHSTLEEYRQQKGRLFAALGRPRTKPWPAVGVINADDPEAPYFAHKCSLPRYYGVDSPADVMARDIECTSEGSRFTLHAAEGQIGLQTSLVGRFNVRNWLAAAAAALASGARLQDVARAAERARPIPGRLERLDCGQPFSLYVDFAHTPQGLAAALDALRELHPEQTLAVFGHAGHRDMRHRHGLVEAARSRCRFFVLTMDDPYDEDPASILSEMREAALALGCEEGQDFRCILDRREAFTEAFRRAGAGDAVLLAGRGHETVIPLGDVRLLFHDATVARELLS